MEKKKIQYADPYIEEEDVEAVAKAVREKRLSQGIYVEEFEHRFAEHMKCSHALATNNGTAALHLAVSALGLTKGDEVIVPSFTFVATANCVLYVGAKPVFVDIDPNIFNITSKEIEKALSKKTKAIIIVHYGGQMADMDPILQVAETHSLHVIEDASEAHGATYGNRLAGTMGEIGCFSFYPNKNMTTGEGGMIVTNSSEIAEKARMLRSQGQDSRFHHVTLGFNYKMTDIQAALGLVQLKRLNWVLSRKKLAAEYYKRLLSNVEGITLPCTLPKSEHTYMFYTVKFRNEEMRDKVKKHLEENGVETVISFPPVHLQPFYKDLYGFKEGFLPVTEQTAKTVLSLPIYPHIRREDQDYIAKMVKEGINK